MYEISIESRYIRKESKVRVTRRREVSGRAVQALLAKPYGTGGLRCQPFNYLLAF